ncbi:MAG: DUF1659 domain-containing protein [Phascolarctobacterium sp.]|uniref:DUF1659 domain-containing protein n=1 Tax=Phascolarctobacterium sp. TaxID=2049039 RepID=UPI0026DCFF3D|nr:DUF1659 domain-containing protein [Phascolarctobacterium sp.]MDO4921912.1 DUF1659 domain-containing protein [Phascolarctobacterium sp.]
MPITKSIEKRSLILNVEDGTNDDGSIKTKARTYNKIKAAASDEAIVAVANALGGLMAAQVHSVNVSEKVKLEDVQ